MNIVSSPITHLQRRQTFSLRGEPGQQLQVRSGEVWVTQDGDPRDLVLEAHQCFTLDRAGHVLISALRDASFAVASPKQAGRWHVAPAELRPVSTALPSVCY